MYGLGPRWVRFSPNSKKSGLLPDQIPVHFGSPSQNVLKSYLENPGFVILAIETNCTEIWSGKSWICPIWGQSDTHDIKPCYIVSYKGFRPSNRAVISPFISLPYLSDVIDLYSTRKQVIIHWRKNYVDIE